MRQLPLIFWQIPVEEGAGPRFSVGTQRDLNTAPLADAFPPLAPALESLRGDIIVALFNRLTAAALLRPHLAPILMDALDCAVERLMATSQHGELCAVKEWLDRK